MTDAVPNPAFPLEEESLKQRMQGLGYCRAAGIGLGLFFIGWAPLSFIRWDGYGPTVLLTFEVAFFTVYGLLLAMPWNKITAQRTWKIFFGLLVACSASFAFIMVIDTMFQHIMASELNERPPPPAFQGMQIFFGLMQVPVVLFLRRPELLD